MTENPDVTDLKLQLQTAIQEQDTDTMKKLLALVMKKLAGEIRAMPEEKNSKLISIINQEANKHSEEKSDEIIKAVNLLLNLR